MKGLFTLSIIVALGLSAATSGADAPEYVKRAIFTYGIEDREPIDDIQRVPADSTNVYFFTEIVDLENTSVTHRWTFNGETMAEVSFEVGGPRWRVYSSKELMPSWTGTWRAEVIDADGVVMLSKTFEYYQPE